MRAADARKEVIGWETKDTHLTLRAANADEESKINQGLYEQNFISRPRLLELNTRKAEAAAGLAENAAEISRAKQKISEVETAIAKLRNDWASNVLEELRRAQEARSTALERLGVAQDRLRRTSVVAPNAGTVHSLRYTTVGGVVQPGGIILEVTPEAEQLVVEARLSPDDIDMVHINLAARVRLTAYKARRHFSLKGTVTQVSSDTFRDEKSGYSYYKVRIEIPDEELKSVDRMALVPGMLAQAEIITGERTALRYLLDPIVDSFYRALKEK
jgi:HlyD family secretion protein/epimerase transport system membrane fusion protein